MEIDEILAFVSGLSDGVVTWTPDEHSDAPAIARGDSFFFYNPAGDVAAAQRQPFATVVTKDYGEFDDASDLDRAGAFRLNIAVGRTTFTELLGYAPKEHAEQHARIDYTVADRLLPHPVYAAQGWIAVVNPGPATGEQVRTLLRRRTSGTSSATTVGGPEPLRPAAAVAVGRSGADSTGTPRSGPRTAFGAAGSRRQSRESQ